MEDRTNRQLRQTIVITGVEELQDESWDDTRELLAEEISKGLKNSFNSADKMLNRVHRGSRSRDPKYENMPRKIFAALYCWSDCEHIINSFRDLII